MNGVVRALALLLSLLVTQSEAAVTWHTESDTGQLMEARGVQVGQGLYRVMFSDGSCVGLGLCGDQFAFNDYHAAMDASTALLEQVFRDVGAGSFDSIPWLTKGCPSTEVPCTVVTPYFLDGDIVSLATAQNGIDEDYDDGVFSFQDSMGADTSVNSGITYAIWTRTGSIPEPSTLALMLTGGLVMLGLPGVRGSRRRIADHRHGVPRPR